MKTKNKQRIFLLLFLTFINLRFLAIAQEKSASYHRDSLISAAREIIKSTQYCGLVTLDKSGQPQVRTMNPYPLGDELIFWFATNRSSRKVAEIKNNATVCVYYADHNSAKGYVIVKGKATIIDDREFLTKMKRDYWEKYKIDWQNNFVLIKIMPTSIEVINYKHGINNDPATGSAPVINFNN